MANNDCINVCLATDKNYVQHAGVVISSILKHANPDENLAFYIIGEGLDDKDKSQLKAVIKKNTHTIEFTVPDFDKLPILTPPEHISKATLFRLQLPNLLPEVKKVIYLDCDMIVMSSLKELWETELNNNIGAGVADYYKRVQEHKKELGCENIVYINAGMFLFDLELARKENIADEFMAASVRIQDVADLVDQDVINVVLGERIVILPLKWNLATGYFRGNYDFQYYSDEEIAEAVKSPGIIHFTGKTKPWVWRRSRNPFWFEYFKALKGTPWNKKYYMGLVKKVFFPYKKRKSPATSIFFENK